MPASSEISDISDALDQLQFACISRATGGTADPNYELNRQKLLTNPTLADRLPRFIRNCRDLEQFWGFIKYKFSTYAERRDFIWAEFRPIFDYVESSQNSPSDSHVADVLPELNSEYVQSIWHRALERRVNDPEGAITLARTLLESVCKHILDEDHQGYGESDDLPKLYRLTAEGLNIAPSQHSVNVFKQILGGCTAVVEGLGALRNRISDAHGQGHKAVKPAARHAELAVNLAGTMATFLVSTWATRKEATEQGGQPERR